MSWAAPEQMHKGQAGWKRFERANRPPPEEAWVWITREMLESLAWRRLTLPARRIVDRIILEHMAHGGTQNGRLVVTYDQFRQFGISRKKISGAISLADKLGLVDVVERGGRGYGIARRPSLYALTWLPRCDGSPPSNRWKSFSPLPHVGTTLVPHGGTRLVPHGGTQQPHIPNKRLVPHGGTALNIFTHQSTEVAQARGPIRGAGGQACARIASKGPPVEKTTGETHLTIPDMPDIPEFLRRFRA
jgi:hypothetical protein